MSRKESKQRRSWRRAKSKVTPKRKVNISEEGEGQERAKRINARNVGQTDVRVSDQGYSGISLRPSSLEDKRELTLFHSRCTRDLGYRYVDLCHQISAVMMGVVAKLRRSMDSKQVKEGSNGRDKKNASLADACIGLPDRPNP